MELWYSSLLFLEYPDAVDSDSWPFEHKPGLHTPKASKLASQLRSLGLVPAPTSRCLYLGGKA